MVQYLHFRILEFPLIFCWICMKLRKKPRFSSWNYTSINWGWFFENSSVNAVISTAQQLWLEWYGAPRKSCSSRIDSGTKRAHKKGSEREFLAKRRRLDEPIRILSHDQARQEASSHLPTDNKVQNELMFCETSSSRIPSNRTWLAIAIVNFGRSLELANWRFINRILPTLRPDYPVEGTDATHRTLEWYEEVIMIDFFRNLTG